MPVRSVSSQAERNPAIGSGTPGFGRWAGIRRSPAPAELPVEGRIQPGRRSRRRRDHGAGLRKAATSGSTRRRRNPARTWRSLGQGSRQPRPMSTPRARALNLQRRPAAGCPPPGSIGRLLVLAVRKVGRARTGSSRPGAPDVPGRSPTSRSRSTWQRERLGPRRAGRSLAGTRRPPPVYELDRPSGPWSGYRALRGDPVRLAIDAKRNGRPRPWVTTATAMPGCKWPLVITPRPGRAATNALPGWLRPIDAASGVDHAPASRCVLHTSATRRLVFARCFRCPRRRALGASTRPGPEAAILLGDPTSESDETGARLQRGELVDDDGEAGDWLPCSVSRRCSRRSSSPRLGRLRSRRRSSASASSA